MKCTRCAHRMRNQAWAIRKCTRIAGSTYLTAAGRIVVGQPGSEEAYYCRRCSPGVQVCRLCGGTPDAPSASGAAWAEPALCTACADLDAFLTAKEARPAYRSAIPHLYSI